MARTKFLIGDGGSPARLALFAVACLALQGCGTLYRVEVNAVNPDPELSGDSYVLIPLEARVDRQSPEFQRYAAYVERGLETNGLTRLPESAVDDADLLIAIQYSVGEPEAVPYTNTMPMFQRQTAGDPEAGTSTRGPRSPGGGSAGSPSPKDALGSQVQDEMLGTRSYTFIKTHYEKYLRIVAKSLDPDHADGAAWQLTAVSMGSTANLDEAIPVLVAAAQPHMGSSTDGAIETKIGASSPKVAAIRAAAPY